MEEWVAEKREGQCRGLAEKRCYGLRAERGRICLHEAYEVVCGPLGGSARARFISNDGPTGRGQAASE